MAGFYTILTLNVACHTEITINTSGSQLNSSSSAKIDKIQPYILDATASAEQTQQH